MNESIKWSAAHERAAKGLDQGLVGAMHAADTCNQGYAPDRDQMVSVTVEVRAVRNFADALMGAMDGKRVTRAGWNASGQYVAMQMTDKHSKMTRPYLYLKNAQNDMVPWVPSQGDLFASDWAILPK